MTDSINLINSTNIEEDNKIKKAYLFLTNEYNNLKKDKLSLINEEISLTKKAYNSQIKEYKNEVDLTLEKEKEIEQLLSKISKIQKRRALIINNSCNDKFYKLLLELVENSKKEKILKNFFSLIILQGNKNERPIKDLIRILKDKEEIKNLIYYASTIYSDLMAKDENKFLNLKTKFEQYFSELDDSEKGQYPFDILFECLSIIFEIIEYEKKIKDNNEILGKLTEKKNAKFVEIKLLELKIKNLNKNKKIIQNNLKIIHSFLDKFNEQKLSISSSQGFEDLFKNIEEYQKQEKEIQMINPPFDVITSLTFGTYYTQSEDSSIKSSKLTIKNNGLNLINNNTINNNNSNINNDLETQQKKIPPIDTYDKIFKSISNDNSNFETNEGQNKKNVNEKAKNEEKNDKKNLNINKNSGKKINNNNFIKNKNKNIINNNSSKENKPKQISMIKNYTKSYDNKYIENIQKNQHQKRENNKTAYNTINKQEEKLIIKSQSTFDGGNNKIKTEEKKTKNDNKGNMKYTFNSEEKELLSEKKIPYNFTELNNLGSRMNQLKHREPDESIEMSMPRENINKIEFINNDNVFNDNSVCDEMVSMNNEMANKKGRNTINDCINKIGVQNNLVVSKELYKDKLFMRRNNNGKLQIEKSIEASTCCVSCT